MEVSSELPEAALLVTHTHTGQQLMLQRRIWYSWLIRRGEVTQQQEEEEQEEQEEEGEEERRHGRWVLTLSSGWGAGSRARQQVLSASFLLSLLLLLPPTKFDGFQEHLLWICEFVEGGDICWASKKVSSQVIAKHKLQPAGALRCFLLFNSY